MDIRQEDAGYYCLLIAILCDLDVNDARKMYRYGPEHPICRKLRKKKVSKGEMEQMDTVSKSVAMKHLWEKGWYYVKKKYKLNREKSHPFLLVSTNH